MIVIENLNFHYKKNRDILQELNLTLKPGYIYGLLGKNGSGKSTLLKTIAGLNFPNHGKCLFEGKQTSQRLVSILENLYFLPEEIYVPSITPEQFVNSTGRFYPKFSQTDFFEYLKILEIDTTSVMTTMSYGQQKKVMIAFSLATNTKLLLLDEPTNGLDIPSKVQFRKLIASALHENKCILLSTHQVRDLESLIDTILILEDRRIVVNSSIETITDKLVFTAHDEYSEQDALYQEESPRGKLTITANKEHKFSKLNLELLFNAVTSGKLEVTEILNQGGYHE